MTTSFTPRFDILSAAQQRLWPELRPVSGLEFVLYGGTAIALRLGHRPSVDFDFFSSSPLNRKKLQNVLPFIAKSRITQEETDTLTMIVPSENATVSVSFFGSITFGHVGKPEHTNDDMLQVASLDDLMATKLKTILQRVEAKDYIDIAAMIDAGTSLPKGLAAACALFGNAFQPSESLRAMTYFQGGDLYKLSTHEKEILVRHASQVRDLPPISIIDKQLVVPNQQKKSNGGLSNAAIITKRHRDDDRCR